MLLKIIINLISQATIISCQLKAVCPFDDDRQEYNPSLKETRRDNSDAVATVVIDGVICNEE